MGVLHLGNDKRTGAKARLFGSCKPAGELCGRGETRQGRELGRQRGLIGHPQCYTSNSFLAWMTAVTAAAAARCRSGISRRLAMLDAARRRVCDVYAEVVDPRHHASRASRQEATTVSSR